ncbi:hypothetical protein BC831DRAFT_292111 [Entophlyctis helioformis]|nr:hypothetical protein BC831DRAFT_292111 [Entophlyctis helioformis]
MAGLGVAGHRDAITAECLHVAGSHAVPHLPPLPALVQPDDPPAWTATSIVLPQYASEMARLQAARVVKADNLWDLFLPELRDRIFGFVGPLTQFLCGRLGHPSLLSMGTKRAIYADAFDLNWRGDLRLLPNASLDTADVLRISTRDMYGRVWTRFRHMSVRERLVQAPMRHMWLECVPPDWRRVGLAVLALRGGHLEYLKHLLRCRVVSVPQLDECCVEWCKKPARLSAVDYAASHGRLEIVQFLVSTGKASMTARTMDIAAESGSLDLVKWLHANSGAGCTTDAMNGAAIYGHLHIVQWLHANRHEGCTTRAMDIAAMQGHLHVVQFLHANRPEGCTVGAVDLAARNGHTHVVAWLLQNRLEGCSLYGVAEARTDKIAHVLVAGMSPGRRQEILNEAVFTNNRVALDRLLRLSQ